jgi:arylsulfatase A-like enzyme
MNLSRRHFIFSGLALPALAAPPAGEQPNVVLILADGVPAGILGCYGNKEIRTPGIDRLAATGTRFLNHFAAAPIPSFGRATLLTGRTTMQLKDSGETTLDKILGGAGYACQRAAGGAEALQFLDAQESAKPFLLIADFAPYAAAPDPKYVQPYAQTKFDSLAQEPPAKNALKNRDMMGKDLAANLRHMAGQTAAFDDEVGGIWTRLSQKKLLNSTLIIFTSTCGSLFSAHGLWGDGEASDPVNLYDEVINTPMIWSWPGRVPPLAVRPELVSALDLVPTLCVLTGAPLPDRNLCGRAYSPLATGTPLPKKQPWKTTVFAQYRNTAMARVERYKVILRDGGKGPGELYDNKMDPKERVNQYDNPQFLTVRTTLSGELGKWQREFSV